VRVAWGLGWDLAAPALDEVAADAADLRVRVGFAMA